MLYYLDREKSVDHNEFRALLARLSSRYIRLVSSIAMARRPSSSVIHTFKLEYLWGHLTNLDQILYEPPHDKTKKVTVHPAKTQISLGIRPAWSESSLCAQWVANYPSFLHADSEGSDQTGRMPRLIWVFAERTCHCVGFVMRRLIWSITEAGEKLQKDLADWLKTLVSMASKGSHGLIMGEMLWSPWSDLLVTCR